LNNVDFEIGLPLIPSPSPFRAAPTTAQIWSADIRAPAIAATKVRSWRVGSNGGWPLGERFQSSNHMGCLKRPHSVDGKPKMQLSGFMESVV
jgi:hypothetical protein